MKNKLVFRILGALASALIIVSVFVPFISVTGFSYSLWNTYSDINSLYLPIMIIVFGAIGVIFFSLNFKTEFAYTSAGAIIFFVIMQTIEILDQGAFSSLSIGYYLLVIGAVLTGLMAFICNLRTNAKVKENIQTNEVSQPSMLDQIDKLYNEQPQIQPIQPVNNVIEPIPVAPVIETPVIQPVEQTAVQSTSVQSIDQPVIQPQISLEETQLNNVDPISTQQISNQIKEQPIENIQTQNAQPVNPVIQEFNQPINPVVQEFSQPVNPVMQDFTVNNVEQPNIQVDNSQNIQSMEPVMPNPVIQEFSSSNIEPQINQGINNNSNSNDVDIFGQPINRQ